MRRDTAGSTSAMRVAKEQLVEILRARGDHDLADRANVELPAQVESDQHREFFENLDLSVDAGDAERHGEPGDREDMHGLRTSEE